MEREDEKASSAARPRRWRRNNKSTLGLVFVLLGAIGVFAAAGIERYSRQNPEFCASCHIMEAHVGSYLNGTHMDSVHRAANVGCKDCHDDYSVAAELRSMWNYALGNYEEVFSRRRFAERMCLKCHISLDYHAVRTDHLRRNPHKGHWPHVRCGFCHPSHAKQVDFCGRCHDNGGQRMTGEPVVARAHNPWAQPKPERPTSVQIDVFQGEEGSDDK